MRIVKKYTAVQIYEHKVNDSVKAKLLFAESADHNTEYWRGYFQYKTEHDTEQEAIEYAYFENKNGKWLILPIVKFED